MSVDNTPEPLAAFPHIKTGSPEEWMHVIKSLFSSAKSEVVPPKDFYAYINMTKLGNATLAGMGSLAEFSHIYTPESSNVLINLLLDGQIKAKLKSNEFYYLADGLYVSHQKDMPIYFTAKYFHSIHVMFQLETLTEFIRLVHENEQTEYDVQRIFESGAHNSYFKKALRQTIQSIDALPEIVNQPMIASQFEQLLLLSFIVSSPHARNSRGVKQRPSTRTVRLAEEYIEANIDQPVRLEDLAEATGQSVRSIQKAFRKYRGCSPSGFLRECRLKKARKMLQESPPDTSIVSVALACGFASHGHFSFCYKRRFGENPLNTLKYAGRLPASKPS